MAIEYETEYELIHDSLIDPILQWLGKDFWATQQVRELLRLALPAWRERLRLLSLDDLRLVYDYRQLVNLTADELALIYASAVVYNEQVAAWQPSLSEAAHLAVLQSLLGHTEPLARRQAAHFLQEFATPEIALLLVQRALQDDAAEVRQIAAHSLAIIARQADPVGAVAVAELVQAVDQPALTERASAALVHLRDLAPSSQHFLPPALRRSLLWQVWARRWQRNQVVILATTLRGLQGGFWGLGLGMGPLFVLDSLQWVGKRPLAGYVFIGVALAGLIGSLMMGSASLTYVILRTLQDRDQPWRNWLITTLVGGGMMAPPLVLLGWTRTNEFAAKQPALAGLLIGMTLVGVATLPALPALPVRLCTAVIVGILSFALCRQLGWFAAESNWGWIVIVGGAAGYGFTFGFAHGSPIAPAAVKD